MALALRQRAAPSWTWALCIELGSEPARGIFFFLYFLATTSTELKRSEETKLERTPEIDFNIFVSSKQGSSESAGWKVTNLATGQDRPPENFDLHRQRFTEQRKL